MSLRRRSLWLLVLGILGVLLVVVAADAAFSRGLRDQRDAAAAAAGALARAAVGAEFERLDLVARDLGTGDGAYAFALSDDLDYRLDRLGQARLERFDVDLVVVLGPRSAARFSYAPAFADRLGAVERRLGEITALRIPADAPEPVRAVVVVEETPMLISARAVLSGEDGAQGRGVVIVGERASDWGARIAPLLSTSPDDAAVTVDVLPAPSPASTVVGAPTVHDGAAVLALPESGEGPAFVLRVEPDAGGGRFVFRALMGAIALVASLLVVLTWVGFDGRVIGRLTTMDASLRRVAAEAGTDLRLYGTWGDDEIGAVASAADAALEEAGRRADGRVADAREATASQIFGEHVVRAMGEGVLVIDADGTCRACNPAAARLLQVDQSDLLGKRDALEDYLPPSVVEAAWQRASVGDGTPQALQRGTADMMLTAAQFRRRPDADPGLILLLRDVSTERRAERLQRGIVSVVSHELRTPLTVIDSTLTLLREQVGDRFAEDELRVVELLGSNAERMHELVNDLLDFSALESGELAADLEAMDLVELAEEVRQLHAPRSDESGVTVEVRASRRPLVIEGDRPRLRQVLTNLLGNAVKYSSAGGYVWVDVHDLGAQGVRVDVTDTGHGIPQAEQGRVFDQFFRASNARRSSRGTGLGLAISRQIAELHGGRLTLGRSSEEGSTFSLYLPPELAVEVADLDAMDIIDEY